MVQVERQKFSLRKNDQVEIIAGRDKGKVGKILKIDSKTGRVTVEKANMVKRHTRPTPKSSGGIIEKELPLHFSNVQIFCAKCNQGVRHGHKWVEGKGTDKKKIRVCKRCNESLDVA